MSLLSSVYPNFAAFYATTTWTRNAAAAAYMPGGAPIPVSLPLPPEYGHQGLGALPHGVPLPVPAMPPASPTDSNSSDHKKSHKDSSGNNEDKKNKTNTNNNKSNNNNNNNAGHSFSKFTIDEILGKKDSREKERCSPPSSPVNLVSRSHQHLLQRSPSHHHVGALVASEAESASMMSAAAITSSPNNSSQENSEDADANARFSWLQCTRYKPPKLPRVKRKDGVKKRKLGRNPRVPFTQHQVSTLEQKFQRTHYLSSVDVAELSAALNLTETRVKIWFQNRRARERRDREQRVQQQQQQGSSQAGGHVSPHSGPSTVQAQRILPPSLASPSSSAAAAAAAAAAVARGFSWPVPTPPNPSAIAHFSHALQHAGTSAFTPVSFPGY